MFKEEHGLKADKSATLLIKLLEPTITDPTGAPRPFDRHTWLILSYSSMKSWR